MTSLLAPTDLNSQAIAEMAGPTGLEPATSCVTGTRSNQLNYGPAVFPMYREGLLVGSVRFERTTFRV